MHSGIWGPNKLNANSSVDVPITLTLIVSGKVKVDFSEFEPQIAEKPVLYFIFLNYLFLKKHVANLF